MKPEVFDTNEPFTDDSDEEEFEFDNGGGGAQMKTQSQINKRLRDYKMV